MASLIELLSNPASAVGMHYLIAGSKTRISFDHLDGNGRVTKDPKSMCLTNYSVIIDELKNSPFRFKVIKQVLEGLFAKYDVSYGDIINAGGGVLEINQMDFKACSGKHMHNAIMTGSYFVRASYCDSPAGNYLWRLVDGRDLQAYDHDKSDENVKKLCANLGIAVEVSSEWNEQNELEIRYTPADEISFGKLRELMAKMPKMPGSEIKLA